MTIDGADERDVRLLLERIARDAAETAEWTGRPAFAPATMRAIAQVPRHRFVAREDRWVAWENRPLAIGFGQTISQPFIVALMTDLLDLRAGDRVLEIGTGCGYQAAVLAALGARVFSIEAVPALADSARRRLDALGVAGVECRCGDGFEGWPERAPFDAIVVTAAPAQVPPALVAQLGPNGRLVIPVGPQGETQMLLRCIRRPDGGVDCERVLPVAFVPMVRCREDRADD